MSGSVLLLVTTTIEHMEEVCALECSAYEKIISSCSKLVYVSCYTLYFTHMLSTSVVPYLFE